MSNNVTAAASVVEKPKFKDQYDNFIGGKWVAPAQGQYWAARGCSLRLPPAPCSPFLSLPVHY